MDVDVKEHIINWKTLKILFSISNILFICVCVCVCVCVCLDKSFIFAKILWNLKTVSFLVNACLTALSFSHSVLSDSLQPRGLQHSGLLCPSPTPRACSNSCPLIWWCHPTISSSVSPFSSLSLIFPSIRSFLMSWLLSGGQSVEASASASVLPMNIQGWFPLGLTGLISLLSIDLRNI